MAMNWFAFFPGLYADPNTGGDKIDFFVNPPQNQAGSTLGGQGISVVSYSDKQDAALEYIKWFSDPAVQAKWWSVGGYSAHNSVLQDPGFVDSQPFAGDFLEAMDAVQDRSLRGRRQAVRVLPVRMLALALASGPLSS